MYSRNRLYISPEEQDRLGSLRLLWEEPVWGVRLQSVPCVWGSAISIL